jgi:hypothetical protein
MSPARPPEGANALSAGEARRRKGAPVHTADCGSAGEARLRAFVETLTDGNVTCMERQIRGRPAWFVDVVRNGVTTPLQLRGDREGDVAIFPELQREADVMAVLLEHGIPVPRIHGQWADPPCIA